MCCVSEFKTTTTTTETLAQYDNEARNAEEKLNKREREREKSGWSRHFFPMLGIRLFECLCTFNIVEIRCCNFSLLFRLMSN